MFGQKFNINLGEISNQNCEHKLSTESRTSNIDHDARYQNQSDPVKNSEPKLVSFTLTLTPEPDESSDFDEFPSVLPPGEQLDGSESVLPSTNAKSSMSRMSSDLPVSVTSFCRYYVNGHLCPRNLSTNALICADWSISPVGQLSRFPASPYPRQVPSFHFYRPRT